MIAHYNNTPIFYDIQGEGPAVILLHGFLESSTMWQDITPHLIKNHTVIIIDLPGHGQSGCIGAIHSMELMAETVFEILKTSKITSAHFVGHSMGGYVALAFAERYKEFIDSITLLNSTTSEDSTDRKLNRNRALKVIAQNRTAFISMAINNLFPENSRNLYNSEIKTLIDEALQFPEEGITAAIKGMKIRKDRTSVLKNFSNKKTMICGTLDPVVPFSEMENIAKITNTTLIKVNGGHMSWIENKGEIVKILHFIE